MTLAGAAGVGSEKRDDHLGRLMIIWVGERCKPSLARRACVRGIRDDHLGLWVVPRPVALIAASRDDSCRDFLPEQEAEELLGLAAGLAVGEDERVS